MRTFRTFFSKNERDKDEMSIEPFATLKLASVLSNQHFLCFRGKKGWRERLFFLYTKALYFEYLMSCDTEGKRKRAMERKRVTANGLKKTLYHEFVKGKAQHKKQTFQSEG